MNIATQTKKFNYSGTKSFWKSIVVTGIIAFFGTAAYSQADCNTIMACNDLVQISLGANCTETVMPDMILEGQAYDNEYYTVLVTTENGTVIPNNILTKNAIGKTYQAIVTLDGCDLSCWGYITIEDKLPPVISNCPSATVRCGASTAPGVIPRPTATDACTTVTLTSSDKEIISQCSAPFVKVITRTWTATDAYGNKATCQQTINVTRPTISNVTIPKNYDNIDLPAFVCGAQIKYLPNGAPHPDVTGYPGGIDCANIMYFYNDVVFNICGASIKVLRQWTVIDWCTGRDTVAGQVIKIIDDAPPVCVSPSDFKFDIATDEGKCTGTFKVPAPNVIFECSKYDYVVGYKLRTANGTPFINPVFDNVIKTTLPNGTYFYTIKNLPADTSWIVYQITDACGNYSECFTEVIVKDNEAPSPVCEAFTVVSIDDAGIGDLFASSIDDASSDNCGVEKFQIKRKENKCGRPEDLEFREKVIFCCADVSSDPKVYQQVVLRVFDKAGNFSDCIGNVKVQDKKTPKITIPPNITLSCEQDYKNSKLTGRATATDNCSIKIDSVDVVNLKCGLGTITRTWRVTDSQGLVDSKIQIITIKDNTPFVRENISFPGDLKVNGCLLADATPEKLNSRPTYVNADCADIAISFDDDVYTSPGSCLNILRTWRVVNWCDANPQNPVYFTFVQKITLTNSVPPVVVSGCGPRTINSLDNDCEEYVEHSITATDDCTPSELLKYTWQYDRDNNGTVDQTGTGNFYAKVYPAGKHKMTFTVKDACENTTTCSYIFTVKDNKPPTPICNSQVTWVLDEAGKAVVWASDFDLKSADLCDGSKLKFSFTEDGSQSSKSFTCADVPNGVSATIPLKMYVIDSDGNSEFCDVKLILQDSPTKNACPNTGNLTATISGKIVNKIDEAFSEIKVALENKNENTTTQKTTTSEGKFKFEEVPLLNGYMVNPIKKDDVLNGVSTLDLVLIQRHILGSKLIDNPYDLIAADVNKDKKVTAADLVALRKVILGVDNNFNANNPWRFVPASYSFADPKFPHDFPQGVVLDELSTDVENLNFTAVKTGDVNNSATYNIKKSVNVEARTAPLVLVSNNRSFTANQNLSVDLKVSDNVNIAGLQMSIAYDKSQLEFVNVTSSKLIINNENYFNNDAVINISLDQKANVDAFEGDELLSINFKSKSNGNLSSIQLEENRLTNEVYDNEFNSRGIKVEWLDAADDRFDGSIKNHPNPFSDFTALQFSTPNDGIATLKVMDATGKLVYKNQDQFVKGNNKIIVKKEHLNGHSGIYFYQMEINGKIHSGAMILSE